MAIFPFSMGRPPGFYGIPDCFKIETHQKGFRLFRVIGMYTPPPDIIGSYRDIAKHIFTKMIDDKAPYNFDGQIQYWIHPFHILIKPDFHIVLTNDTKTSEDIIVPIFLANLSHELQKLTNLMPFI